MPSLSLSESFLNSDLPPLPTAPEMIMIPRKTKNSFAETALSLVRLPRLIPEAASSSHLAKEE
jgi:hypothetical protein